MLPNRLGTVTHGSDRRSALSRPSTGGWGHGRNAESQIASATGVLTGLHRSRRQNSLETPSSTSTGACPRDNFSRCAVPPRNAIEEFFSKSNHTMYESLGAVAFMLRTTAPLTYLLGVPGQGKLTLGQYLSQMHRVAILPGDKLGDRMPPVDQVADPKMPLRIDLKDYAAWLCGDDPFGDEEPPSRPKLRKKSQLMATPKS
jgi:hypothetical protein